MVTVNSKRYIMGEQKWDFDFKGLSTDTKPTESFEGQPICENSLFLELDTGDVYYYDGEDWNKVGA